MSELRISPPPPDAVQLDLWTLTTSKELQDLRAGLRLAISKHSGAPEVPLDDIPERMVLVATELATNGIRHGRPPTEVRLLRADSEFVLDVADHDLTSIPELADVRPLGAGGHGLRLAQTFSLEVGWYANDTTKHIWATFPVKAA